MTKYYQKNSALGSVVELCFVAAVNQGQADQLFAQLWREVYVFERRCSRFLPGSELSFLNRHAGIKQFVTPELRDVLLAARQLGRETAGLYNPFILPALQAVGYDHSLAKGYEHDQQDDYSHRAVARVTELEIGDDWARIPANAAVDLGGCGKGYLADRLADMVAEQVSGYWLSVGGDVAVGGSDNGAPWKLGIQSAKYPDKDAGTVTIPVDTRAGVATSGTNTRKGPGWHHLIDPRTMRSAKTDIQVATVVCGDVLHADVLASCAVVLGSGGAPEFLKRHGVHGALLQHNGQLTSYGDVISIDASADAIL